MADVLLPQLGESVTEGTLGRWLKKVGDPVSKYEPLVEITTDKVNAEVPSDFAGVLAEVLVQEGETVRVGTVICRIQEPASDAEEQDSSEKVQAQAERRDSAAIADAQPALRQGRFSPAVLRLAQENAVDLTQVVGSGEGGRITRKDVLGFIESRTLQAESFAAKGLETAAQVDPKVDPKVDSKVDSKVEPGVTKETSSESAILQVDSRGFLNKPGSLETNDDVTVLEPSAIRKTIAKRMVESKHTAPHAWTMVEADVSRLVSLRSAQKTDFKSREGIDITFMPFFIKAVVEGLKQFPMLNASWVDDRILVKKRIHISIAVATKDALIVPVIHDADRLSVAGLAHAVNDLAARARSGRLSLDDVQGGTFTVNNTGAFGSVLSQPIINSGQAAILSFETIVKRPVVVGDAIAIRSMMNLSLSLDHRLLDGWVAGQFLQVVLQRLEAFGEDTILY